MKTEISRDSYSSRKRYSGVYQQQGRMLSDADWNELVDVLKGQLKDALKDVVGDGSPLQRGVVNNDAVQPKLDWGYVFIDGMQALIRPADTASSATDFEYLHQSDFPEAPAVPVAPGDYVLYADVWERTVTQLLDGDLRDKGLHGADTCTRKQVLAQVKWCADDVDPETAPQNPHQGNTKATVTLLQMSTEPDPCDPCASEVKVKSRVGNYLFRLEVHDVKGSANAPDEVTFKWSGENGAIQSEVIDSDVAAHFKAGEWAYEFFDDTSERHLGVHLANGAWQPTRNIMQDTFVLPTDVGKPNQFVRRWDGYCTLKKNGSNLEVDQQYGHQEGDAFVSIAGDTITIELASLNIELTVDTAIVAGDYWLAEIRESVHQPNDVLIEDALPVGIEHRYLTLGQVVGGVLQVNPEADRKYAFPSLTKLTSMYIAGGDGQEVVPDEPLPHPLRVGVANGEQPVPGAGVRFQSMADDDTLTPLSIVTTNNEGIAEYLWTPDDSLDAFLKIRASLVDPNNTSGDIDLPPLYFSANLVSADQVAYEPQCLPDDETDTVHHLLLGPDSTRLGTDGYYTVKEALDALLCELKATHIPYEDPACVAPSVRALLADIDVNTDGHITVKDALDALLCQMTAAHVPYDPTIKGTRWDDVNAEEADTRPETVQAAIDDLVDNLQSEDVKYALPDCGSGSNTLKDYLQPLIFHEAGDSAQQFRIKALWDALLCNLGAETIPINKSDSGLCPELKDNADVNTIQDALKVLCAREQGGGCCTIDISADDDIVEKLSGLSGSGLDAHICISHGNYSVKEPVKIEGCGHVNLQGCGDGSYVEAANSESAFFFSNCQSVIVRDISLRSGDLNTGGEFDHLNGTLTIHDTEKVMVENVTLNCAAGEKKMASCLTVSHSTQTTSLRVIGCDINPGEQQLGMLLVNVDCGQVEGNKVKVRARNNNRTFTQRLKNKSFLASVRKIMVSDLVVEKEGVRSTPGRNIVSIPYEGRIISFKTQEELMNPWLDYFKGNPMPTGLTNEALVKSVKAEADRILKAQGEVTVPGFKEWVLEVKVNLPAIAFQGIVCGGRVANDVVISGNTITGVTQGVHVGLSDRNLKEQEPFKAGRITISGNRVVNYLSRLNLGNIHGIFIGNFNLTYVENNQLDLIDYEKKDYKASGIRIFGHFGDMLQIRGNRIRDFEPGIFARAIDVRDENIDLWQVENNRLVNTGAPSLIPGYKFITNNNLH